MPRARPTLPGKDHRAEAGLPAHRCPVPRPPACHVTPAAALRYTCGKSCRGAPAGLPVSAPPGMLV
ncbi:hypothetical protein PATSB16_15020 [Pandoraea thiooxydans]|nr:hypothetical protein PATSB16_15020 [Pandoraea thiooxydans]